MKSLIFVFSFLVLNVAFAENTNVKRMADMNAVINSVDLQDLIKDESLGQFESLTALPSMTEEAMYEGRFQRVILSPSPGQINVITTTCNVPFGVIGNQVKRGPEKCVTVISRSSSEQVCKKPTAIGWAE